MRLSFADGLFWLSVACCAIAQFFIIRSIAAAHRTPGSPALTRRRGAVEMMWAVLPAVALAVLLFYTWRAIRPPASTQPAVVVTRSGDG